MWDCGALIASNSCSLYARTAGLRLTKVLYSWPLKLALHYIDLLLDLLDKTSQNKLRMSGYMQ